MEDRHDEAARNLGLARRFYAEFDPHSTQWEALVAEDIDMRLPYGGSVGIPSRIDGKATAMTVFKTVIDTLSIRFHDISVQSLADPCRRCSAIPGQRRRRCYYRGTASGRHGRIARDCGRRSDSGCRQTEVSVSARCGASTHETGLCRTIAVGISTRQLQPVEASLAMKYRPDTPSMPIDKKL